MIPLPSVVSTIASTFSDIPNVAPFLLAMALTIETAPCTVAFAFAIKILLTMLFSSHYKALSFHAKFQMLW